MLQSMTGYGKATGTYNDKQIRIEIKSLNSKQMDISTRMPGQYREKDLDLRRMVTQQLERGKVDLSINIASTTAVASTQINSAILKDYYNQIKQLSDAENIPLPADWFSTLLRLPEVLKNEEQQLEENEWLEVAKITQEAIDQLVKFRIQEGASLANVFTAKVDNIERLLGTVGQYETERIERVKTRLRDGLQNINDNYNADRFEQELIFYIEKLDVNEEKSRLKNHLDYFRETMSKEHNPGKKLGFIAQEMGREINTLGSKANHAELQKIVVLMKDELEQIKEQVLNVL
ncbi:MAG: hypothetical protein H6Q17_800 [Bacteroidetes bacterium]|nr:hypothetical protein [Bacteroidota bacterium]